MITYYRWIIGSQMFPVAVKVDEKVFFIARSRGEGSTLDVAKTLTTRFDEDLRERRWLPISRETSLSYIFE